MHETFRCNSLTWLKQPIKGSSLLWVRNLSSSQLITFQLSALRRPKVLTLPLSPSQSIVVKISTLCPNLRNASHLWDMVGKSLSLSSERWNVKCQRFIGGYAAGGGGRGSFCCLVGRGPCKRLLHRALDAFVQQFDFSFTSLLWRHHLNSSKGTRQFSWDVIFSSAASGSLTLLPDCVVLNVFIFNRIIHAGWLQGSGCW